MPQLEKPSGECGLEGGAFFDAIDHDDDLIAVVRGHIYVERRLNGLLLKATPGADPYLLKLSFSEKVDVARRLGLISSELKRATLWLGELRNRFAHQATAIAVEDADLAKKRSTKGGRQYIKEMIDHYKRKPDDAIDCALRYGLYLHRGRICHRRISPCPTVIEPPGTRHDTSDLARER